MSASQPLSLVTDYGELSSANATSAVTSAQTVKTGVLYVVCSEAKAGGHIAVCNTANQAGVGSFHVARETHSFIVTDIQLKHQFLLSVKQAMQL